MGNSRILREFVFWGVWLIIPLIMEILVGIISVITVVLKSSKNKPCEMGFMPRVTVLIPVYNSGKTLKACIDSIIEQEYSIKDIEVFLIDNGSKDNSYEVFIKYQAEHPELKLWWISSSQGKSKALNKGIFASTGRYIINIDSDGCLDKFAVRNIVQGFEKQESISCMTGVVLIDPVLIEKTPKGWLRQLRRCEFYEYMESFLVGRNFNSSLNSMYTLAGAFSAFRSEVLFRTQLYNSETLGEDTHMTFQIRNLVGGDIIVRSNAFFYVDPIESLDKLYIQRQRWQRGGIEVANLFPKMHVGNIWGFVTKFAMRILVLDHTLIFPRLIWLFAIIYLYFNNYPLKLLVGANLLLYVAYVMNSFIYLLASLLFLNDQTETRKYAIRHWYTCFLVPLYRFVLYWFRLAGIINSIKQDSKWRTTTLSEEINTLSEGVAATAKKRLSFVDKLRRLLNYE
jgi:putative glycosyltransferase (exosortase G-associated)